MSPIDLTPFCSADDIRDYLRAPFTVGDYTYACNGALLIRVDQRSDAVPTMANHLTKAIQHLNEMMQMPAQVKSRLDTIVIESKPCARCNGTGRGIKCPECEGAGQTTADTFFSEYEVDCMTCSETGMLSDKESKIMAVRHPHLDLSETECTSCQGTGKKVIQPLIFIGLSSFSADQIEKLKTLPDAEISTFHELSAGLIHFTGGVAILMPMRS